MVKRILTIAAFLVVTSNAHAGLLCYGYQYAPNLVQAVQTILHEQGFYDGAIDGKYGPKTREAIRKFRYPSTYNSRPHSLSLSIRTRESSSRKR